MSLYSIRESVHFIPRSTNSLQAIAEHVSRRLIYTMSLVIGVPCLDRASCLAIEPGLTSAIPGTKQMSQNPIFLIAVFLRARYLSGSRYLYIVYNYAVHSPSMETDFHDRCVRSLAFYSTGPLANVPSGKNTVVVYAERMRTASLRTSCQQLFERFCEPRRGSWPDTMTFLIEMQTVGRLTL